MSESFQEVMRDISATLKNVYHANATAIVPGGGTYAMEAVARQFAGDIVEIPPEQNIVSTIPIAVLSFSRFPDAAMRFIEFVASEEGRRIFREHKYTVDPPESGTGG